MNQKGILTIGCSIMALVLLSGCVNTDAFSDMSATELPAIITFLKRDDTLIVAYAQKNLGWENIDPLDSSCILPSGEIKAGDKITDCSGEIMLRWIPSNSLLGTWNFS